MVYPQIDSIQPEQLEYIHNYVDSFEIVLDGPDFLDPENGYRKYIGVKSFIDFMLVNEFSANYDSYGRSTFLYKENISDGGQLKIGPPWDYDRAYAPWTVSGWVWEITHPAWPFPFWWSKFREDPEWVDEVYCRYTSLREDILSDESFQVFIDSIQILLQEPAARNFSKWTELGVTDYNYFVDELSNFMVDRLAWMDDALEPDHVEPPDANYSVSQISFLTYAFDPVTEGASYLWDFGDGTNSTEENPEHTYAGPNSYLVSLIVDQYYGCNAINSSMLDIQIGIEETSQNDFILFPNPFSNQLIIKLNESIGDGEVSLINNLGEMILKQKYRSGNEIVLITNLIPTGTYILKIDNGEKQYFETVVKK